MAPELLAMDINREWLTKADIFSLGLTLYAAASLKDLPKNSLEDPEYENIKAGQLPYLESYSKDFNALLKVCLFLDFFNELILNFLSGVSKLVKKELDQFLLEQHKKPVPSFILCHAGKFEKKKSRVRIVKDDSFMWYTKCVLSF